MKLEIKNRFTQDIIFTHEQEDNSIAITIKAAIDLKINLSRAYLSRADLSGADLRLADLRWSDLSGANLSRAYLSWADLSGADLRWANLSGANLSGADITNTTGNSKEIKSIQSGKWIITFTSEIMSIGCHQHPIKDWLAFDDEKISSMHDDDLEFWKKWKPILKLIMERV